LNFEVKKIQPIKSTLAPCVVNLKTYFYQGYRMDNRSRCVEGH